MAAATPGSETAGRGPGTRARWRAILKRLWSRCSDRDSLDSGAAIAYYALFSIFPLLIGLIALAAHLFDPARAQPQIFDMIDGALPGSGDLVEKNLARVAAASGTLGALGILGLLWTASAAFGAVSRAVNRAWGLHSPRTAFATKIRNFLLTVAATALIAASLGVTAVVGLLSEAGIRALVRVGFDPGVLGQLVGSAASLLSTFAVFALIYKVTPYAETTWRQVVPGALFAAGLFELGKAAFVFYLRIADYSIYGSVGSVIVLLLWLYFSARVLILGAELCVAIERERACA